MNHYGLTGLLDRRADLPRNPKGGPSHQRPVSTKDGLVIHYNGPAVPYTTEDFALLRADAYYHIQKDWDLGELGVQHGDGLMYHLGIGRDGAAYLCRDFADVLWHCGTSKNSTALAMLVIMGGTQRATRAQLATLNRLCGEAIIAGLTTRARVTGHQEESATSCPGTLMADFILPFRQDEIGAPPVADGHYFSETGYYVGGGFWRFWNENGGLRIFGYPQSNEYAEIDQTAATGARTMQVFERSVFEYWPEDPAQTVKLRLCGNDLLAAGIVTPPADALTP